MYAGWALPAVTGLLRALYAQSSRRVGLSERFGGEWCKVLLRRLRKAGQKPANEQVKRHYKVKRNYSNVQSARVFGPVEDDHVARLDLAVHPLALGLRQR